MGRASGGSGGLGGAPLAYATYGPGTTTTYNLTGSLAAIDATNLTISFTAPPGGAVLAAIWLPYQIEPTLVVSDVTWLTLCYTTHGSGTRISPEMRFGMLSSMSATTVQQLGGTAAYLAPVTGLTAGTGYQWDLAGFYNGTAAPALAAVYADSGGIANAWGPATMAIYTA